MKTFLVMAAGLIATTPAAAQTASPAAYVAQAGASDQYEIQSSRLVMASTRDPKIRSFAQMMIQHHTKSTADVKAAATRAKLRPAPPKLMPMQADMVAQLRAQTGTGRDTLYVTQQKTAHQQALALHQSYAQDGSSAPLKAAAAKIVPVVEQHIATLETM
ncbi:DUF4142 domain-containing protein [Sphingomonas corticis]|jgi:putative membrane protein|uniref:DUF4142 domain-containing protein n=1 Tax=Sphingomonas corticis TaxID=2722791 RepID=A0ABX1CPP0_9SPHN|nr:DUF4142 domain-containing protein [Sphingomonas corticis]NJR79917.1 DUF4142 domain-containing protein [Sphingomonas corticis]